MPILVKSKLSTMSDMHVYKWCSLYSLLKNRATDMLIWQVKLLFLSRWCVDDEGTLKDSALQGLQDHQNWGPHQVRLQVSIFECLPFNPSVIALLAFECVWNRSSNFVALGLYEAACCVGLG